MDVMNFSQQYSTARTSEYVMYRHLLTRSLPFKSIHVSYDASSGYTCDSSMVGIYLSDVGAVYFSQLYSSTRTTEYVMYRHLLTSDHLYSCVIRCIYWLYPRCIDGWNLFECDTGVMYFSW